MLINDLDKLMEEMGEKQQRNLHTEASIHHTEGIFLPPEEETNVSIEPCTGLIEEYNALIGDLYIPDEDDEDDDNDEDEVDIDLCDDDDEDEDDEDE